MHCKDGSTVHNSLYQRHGIPYASCKLMVMIILFFPASVLGFYCSSPGSGCRSQPLCIPGFPVLVGVLGTDILPSLILTSSGWGWVT